MFTGIYSSASGMEAGTTQLNVIANNIGNASTPAFKRSEIQFQPFDTILAGITSNSGVFVSNINTIHSNGPLIQTGDNLDVAISKPDVFFTIDTPQGTAYTRNGQFSLDPYGALTLQGSPVRGKNGAIIIPDGSKNINIDSDGNVNVDGTEVDKLNMVKFDNPDEALTQIGASIFRTSDPSIMPSETRVADAVQQGYLEQSNVDTMKELVDMINTSRLFDANSRTLRALSNCTQRLIETVGQIV